MCGVCVFVVCGGVWCVVWHAEKTSVCRFKTSPCVPAPRAHVLPHAGVVSVHRDVSNLHTEVFWTDTREEEEGEGGRGEGGHRQFSSPKFADIGLSRASERFTESNHWILQIFKFEKRSRTTRARFLQSFAFPDKA